MKVRWWCVARLSSASLAIVLSFTLCLQSSLGQEPPVYSPDQLDTMVSRIALYTDTLLAQILTASTFADQIPDAAQWADEHHYLTAEALAQAITNDQLSWDPSVQALLPFPSVLDMMASDMNWTSDRGNAVLAERGAVMDAVQRMRKKAKQYGYLRSNQQIIVSGDSYIEILPANPAFTPFSLTTSVGNALGKTAPPTFIRIQEFIATPRPLASSTTS